MTERLRARLAMPLLKGARRLLKIRPKGGLDFDTCVYCGANGYEEGPEVHAEDCPSETGVYPVELHEMWPNGPAQCENCKTTLWPGDTYSHIPQEPIGGTPVFLVACTGCALLAQVEPAPNRWGGDGGY